MDRKSPNALKDEVLGPYALSMTSPITSKVEQHFLGISPMVSLFYQLSYFNFQIAQNSISITDCPPTESRTT